jgi:hypothetical protein
MSILSRFETLTNRHEQILEKVEALIVDLRYLVQLLEANIEAEEECTGIFDPANSSYPILARQNKARREKLLTAISQLKGPRAVRFH